MERPLKATWSLHFKNENQLGLTNESTLDIFSLSQQSATEASPPSLEIYFVTWLCYANLSQVADQDI